MRTDAAAAEARGSATSRRQSRRAAAGARGTGDDLRGSLAFVYFFNILVTAFIFRRYLVGLPEGTSAVGWLAALLALLSTAVFVNALVLALTWPVAAVLRRRWFVLVVAPVVFGAFNTFLYADSVVFRLYRFHVNPIVMAVVFAPDAGDSFTVGAWTYIRGFLVLAVIVGTELGFSLWALEHLRAMDWFPRFARRRWLAATAGVLVAVFLADKTIHAWADIADRTEFMRGRQLFPLYIPVTAKKFARGRLGVEVVRRESLRVDRRSGVLDYPKSPLVFPEDGLRPNVVVILLEGARFDGLRPQVMPFLHRFGEENIVCERHVASGNCTRFGVFGLMYGLYPTYFDRFFAERRGPVIVSELKRLGYAFNVIGCASMDFSEFRKTCFVEVVESIHDQWDDDLSTRHLRDVKLTDFFIEFLDGPEGRGPFFGFLFYDASHEPYVYEPEHEVFPVDIEPQDIDFVAMANDPKQAKRLLNRYYNALHYDDSQIERVVKALAERKLLENTLVFVTGDHGEEFGESGFVGHLSAFDRWQVHTPMVAHIPGVRGRRVTRLTSHVDVVPTILSYMGVENSAEDYSLGAPVTASEGPPFAVAMSYVAGAVVDEDVALHFGLEAVSGRLTARDWDWKPVAEPRRAIGERRRILLQVMENMSRFVKRDE